jgi:hypothetical protein
MAQSAISFLLDLSNTKTQNKSGGAKRRHFYSGFWYYSDPKEKRWRKAPSLFFITASYVQ